MASDGARLAWDEVSASVTREVSLTNATAAIALSRLLVTVDGRRCFFATTHDAENQQRHILRVTVPAMWLPYCAWTPNGGESSAVRTRRGWRDSRKSPDFDQHGGGVRRRRRDVEGAPHDASQ
ncbi:MAG: hypothetical protein R3B96_12570 [Pirellulaceae bacterium]